MYGAADTPPARVVQTARTGPGAGHSGVIQPAGICIQGSLSGQLEGCAFLKGASFMHASNAAIVRGRRSKLVLTRLPLKTCGTRQQSAMVGISP